MESINYFLDRAFGLNPGNSFLKNITRVGPTEGLQDDLVENKYDDLWGFPKGRKKREIVATREEVDSGNVPEVSRDYCAHHYLKLKACKRDHMPNFLRCHHYKSELFECQYQE